MAGVVAVWVVDAGDDIASVALTASGGSLMLRGALVVLLLSEAVAVGLIGRGVGVTDAGIASWCLVALLAGFFVPGGNLT